MTDLSKAEADMMHRLKIADGHRETGAVVFVHVSSPDLVEALKSVVKRGLATCWWGDGKDAGLLLGRITPEGRRRP